MKLKAVIFLVAAAAVACAPAMAKNKPAPKPVVIKGESCEQNMECSWTTLNVSRTAETKASSWLDNKADYAAKNVLDGNPATAWCEGKPDTGKGESLRITFKEPVQITALLISAGYDKNADLFSKNSRVKKATLVLSDRSKYELRFGEHFIDMNDGKSSYQPIKTQSAITNSPQMFTIAANGAKPRKVSWMMLVIDEAVPGWKYKDTCISSIDIIPRAE